MPEELISPEYVRLLENLVEDYDEIGFANVCDCNDYRTSDRRCCWVRRSWERLLTYREDHFDSYFHRITERSDNEG